jgi:hypothetical protein
MRTEMHKEIEKRVYSGLLRELLAGEPESRSKRPDAAWRCQ